MTFCPKCKEYLARESTYKFCMYCGWKYNINELIDDNPNNKEKQYGSKTSNTQMELL